MTAASDVTPATPAPERAPLSRTRPLFWSVRRELWENRAIFVAPVVVAAVMLLGFAVSMFSGAQGHTVHRTVTDQVASSVSHNVEHNAATPAPGVSTTTSITTTSPEGVKVVTDADISPAQKAFLQQLPYAFAAAAMVVTLFLVAVFYCLGALHNERRDRSILFWKSLPVPDITTVASKALVPLVIMPPIAFAAALATQLIMAVMHLAALAAHAKSSEVVWSLPLTHLSLVLAYGLVAMAFWWAPLYAWLLLVGGWARRAPFLWAVLPPLLLALAETIAFHTKHVSDLIGDRLTGGFGAAFVVPSKATFKALSNTPNGWLPVPDPAKFVSTPGLWIGLVVAGALLAAAVWSRRYRDPV